MARRRGTAVVQRFKGRGIIRHGALRLAEADYDVIVTPAELRGTGRTYEAGWPLDRERKVAPDITGFLLGPLCLAQEFAEDIHTLVLEDGREFDFRVVQPQTNEIAAVTVLRPSSAGRRDE
jgi:hypothetical protein